MKNVVDLKGNFILRGNEPTITSCINISSETIIDGSDYGVFMGHINIRSMKTPVYITNSATL